MKKKIKFNLRRMSDSTLEVFTQAVVKAMTESPFFPGPPPELTAAEAATIAFSKALAIAKMGGKNELADKDAKHDILLDAFFALYSYVNLTANGDEQVLTASAFDFTKTPEPTPPLGEVRITEANNSQPNAITVSVNRQKGVRMYQYSYTEDPITPESEWVRQSSTRSKFTFKNLKSGKRYWFKVMAMGVNEQVQESEPVLKMAA